MLCVHACWWVCGCVFVRVLVERMSFSQLQQVRYDHRKFYRTHHRFVSASDVVHGRTRGQLGPCIVLVSLILHVLLHFTFHDFINLLRSL